MWSIMSAIALLETLASRSFCHVASSVESCGGSPASREASMPSSSCRSSARLAKSAKCVKARMTGLASAGSMSRKRPASFSISPSPRWSSKAARRAVSTRLKTSSPSCSRITCPRIRPRWRISSQSKSCCFAVAVDEDCSLLAVRWSVSRCTCSFIEHVLLKLPGVHCGKPREMCCAELLPSGVPGLSPPKGNNPESVL